MIFEEAEMWRKQRCGNMKIKKSKETECSAQREWRTKIFIVILEYISIKNIFEKVHQETFDKSGCWYIIPGQYLAIDPKGRAVAINTVYFYLIFDNFME